MHSFSELALIEPLQRALRDEGYDTPTPIQQQAVPPLLEGRDLLGCARTGTGKTAAFALPILQHLAKKHVPAPRKGTRVLVVVPTRELATQVAASFTAYGRHLRSVVTTVFGGVGQGPQVKALGRGVDVLVATPGRLLDLMNQGHAKLGSVEVLVLDEADQMLDMGFLPDIRRILAAVPKRRQTLLFSATMPAPIEELAGRILHDPAKVFVTPAASTAELVDQSVHHVSRDQKPHVLGRLLKDPQARRVLVFTRTKRGCDRVARRLCKDGINAQAIHGDKSQGSRERALEGFRAGRVRVLVATDIAARGIDVDDVTHVVNYEIPNVPETYVHRIGRTARAGSAGVAISLCSPEERDQLRDIERLIRRSLDGPDGPNGSGPESAPDSRREERRTGQGQGQRSRRSNGARGGGSRPARPARGKGRGGRAARRDEERPERARPLAAAASGGGRPVRDSGRKLDTFGTGV